MTDQERAVMSVMNFLRDDNKRILLVKGYDDEAKLRVALSCLEKVYDRGIIRTSSMSDESFHINFAFNKNLLPNIVTSTNNYKIGKMVVSISSYKTHTQSNPSGNQDTFTLFHPVQTVLDDSKEYKKFLNELGNTYSSKILLVTTNEHTIKNWNIVNYVDEVFFYSVENDNPEIMKNLRINGEI